jgi:hypothetical protein
MTILTKLKRLKAFKSVLEAFDLAVSSSLQEKKPLNKKDLTDWLARLADIVFIFSIEDVDKNLDQYKELEYHLGYYEILDDEEKNNVTRIVIRKYKPNRIRGIEKDR